MWHACARTGGQCKHTHVYKHARMQARAGRSRGFQGPGSSADALTRNPPAPRRSRTMSSCSGRTCCWSRTWPRWTWSRLGSPWRRTPPRWGGRPAECCLAVLQRARLCRPAHVGTLPPTYNCTHTPSPLPATPCASCASCATLCAHHMGMAPLPPPPPRAEEEGHPGQGQAGGGQEQGGRVREIERR